MEPTNDRAVFNTVLSGSQTTDVIVALLRSRGYKTDYLITQKTFPLISPPVDYNVQIEIVDPGRSVNEVEGLKLLTASNLQRPTYEHALRFAEQHTRLAASNEKSFIVFLHEPSLSDDRIDGLLCVSRRPCCLGLQLVPRARQFNRQCVFAGVRSRN